MRYDSQSISKVWVYSQMKKCGKFITYNYMHFYSSRTLTLCLTFCAQDGDSAMRNPSFPLRSPQSGCSPAGSDGTPKCTYLKLERQVVKWLCTYTCFVYGSLKNSLNWNVSVNWIKSVVKAARIYSIDLKIQTVGMFLWAFSFLCIFFMCSLTSSASYILVCFLHSRLSAASDSVTSSICALSEGRWTWPETAVTAKEENPSCKRGEGHVRHRKLPKQGLYEANAQAVAGQVKWVWFCRSVQILLQLRIFVFFKVLIETSAHLKAQHSISVSFMLS